MGGPGRADRSPGRYVRHGRQLVKSISYKQGSRPRSGARVPGSAEIESDPNFRTIVRSGYNPRQQPTAGGTRERASRPLRSCCFRPVLQARSRFRPPPDANSRPAIPRRTATPSTGSATSAGPRRWFLPHRDGRVRCQRSAARNSDDRPGANRFHPVRADASRCGAVSPPHAEGRAARPCRDHRLQDRLHRVQGRSRRRADSSSICSTSG